MKVSSFPFYRYLNIMEFFAVAENFGFYLNLGSCKQCLLTQGAVPFPKLTEYRKTSSRGELTEVQVTQHHSTGLWKGWKKSCGSYQLMLIELLAASDQYSSCDIC